MFLRGHKNSTGLQIHWSRDVHTRFLSTFAMTRDACNPHTILNSIKTKVSDLHGVHSTKHVWENAAKIFNFLQSAASFTDFQPELWYTTP